MKKMSCTLLAISAISTLFSFNVFATEYVRIVSEVVRDGKADKGKNIMLAAIGESQTTTIVGDRNTREVLVKFTPVLGGDNQVMIDTSVSINKMLDTPARQFDKRELEFTARIKVGEVFSVETARA